jgi:hypothetical protein
VRIGPCGLESNRSLWPPPKRERIFLETRAILFDSLTNHIKADLSLVSSEKSAPLLADLALDAQRLLITKISSATALLFERSIRSRRQTKETGARKAILVKMQASGGSPQIAGAEIHPVAASYLAVVSAQQRIYAEGQIRWSRQARRC